MNRFFQKALSAAGILDLQMSDEGIIQTVGNNLPEVLDVDRSWFTGQRFQELFKPVSRTQPGEDFPWKNLVPQASCQARYRFHGPDGRPRFFQWTFLRPQNRGARVLAIGQDVTAKIRSRRRLLKERRNLIERNKELTCLYGMALLNETSSMDLTEILHSILSLIPPAFQFPELTAALIRLDGNVFTTSWFRESTLWLEEPLIIQGRRRGNVQVFYDVDRGLPGKRISFLREEGNLLKTIAWQISLIIDKHEIERRKSELEQQLRHADRLAKIGQLTAGVAHELNEPLAAILGFAQLAQRDTSVSRQVTRDLENIVKGALHAREIIKKLMLFSRQMPLTREDIDLNRVLEESLYFIEARCHKQGIKVLREFEANLPTFLGDASQLQQVLVNLAVNSIQAMPDGGDLVIRTESRGAAILLTVRDTGVGMSKSCLANVFIPFFTTKDVHEGTGLGLSVVHGIITAHHGTIEMESEPGKGTTIFITFPRNPGGALLANSGMGMATP